MPGNAELAHQVQQRDRHLALGPQLLAQPDEKQTCAAFGLGIQPAANLLEPFDLGIAWQVGARSLVMYLVARSRVLA